MQGYRIRRSLPGGQPEIVWQGTATTGIALPKPPPCVTVVYTVEAFHVGPAVVERADRARHRHPQPGARPVVHDAGARAARLADGARQRGRRCGAPAASCACASSRAGVGRLTVSVAAGAATTKPILVSHRAVARSRVNLPRALWREGRFSIRLVTAAPTGKKTRTTTGTLVVT